MAFVPNFSCPGCSALPPCCFFAAPELPRMTDPTPFSSAPGNAPTSAPQQAESEHCASRSTSRSRGSPAPRPRPSLDAPHLCLSFCPNQRGRGRAAHHSSVDARSGPTITCCFRFPALRSRGFQWLLPRHLQRPGPARYLDRFLGGASLPRATITLNHASKGRGFSPCGTLLVS